MSEHDERDRAANEFAPSRADLRRGVEREAFQAGWDAALKWKNDFSIFGTDSCVGDCAAGRVTLYSKGRLCVECRGSLPEGKESKG